MLAVIASIAFAVRHVVASSGRNRTQRLISTIHRDAEFVNVSYTRAQGLLIIIFRARVFLHQDEGFSRLSGQGAKFYHRPHYRDAVFYHCLKSLIII